MTKKDYELIADAIATVEADYKGGFAGVLEDVVDALAVRLQRDNARFDNTRFKLRSMPLLAEWKVNRNYRSDNPYSVPPFGERLAARQATRR